MGIEAAVGVAIDELDERYAVLRLPRPRQEQALAESMARMGQLTPLVVCRRDGRFAIIDGFKRLAGARRLELETLHVRPLPLSEQAAVAAVYSLNRHGRGMLDLEEAFVVRTLVRDQGMAQSEVAELLARHASWVCRRLALVEKLDGQVQDDVRVGLISTTVAREVARLPRGNQPELAAAIRSAALSTRDAAILVSLFEKATDRAQQHALLDQPRQAIERQRGGPRPAPWDARLTPQTNRLRRAVLAATGAALRATAALVSAQPAAWSESERDVLGPLLRELKSASAALLRSAEDPALATVQPDVQD